MPMSSRKTVDTTSLSGVNYAATENLGSIAQKNVFYSGGNVQSQSLRSLTGKTIRGQVVGVVEHWADGTVWDVGNSRSLTPGIDFDAALMHIGGF